MKLSATLTITILALQNLVAKIPASVEAGFSMSDQVQEFTMRYETVDNLIILPVVINNSVHVNLILDTGCRNIILFGKKLHREFETTADRKVEFSGLGNGKPITGNLSLNNTVTMGRVEGVNMPIVIVPHPNLFAGYRHVDGVIGYDIFIKFEVEINASRRLITFRPALSALLSSDFEKVPLQIEDSRPIVESKLFFTASSEQACSLMLDTGSTLGLLVKTTDLQDFPAGVRQRILGRGLNGDIMGITTQAHKVTLANFQLSSVEAGVTYSPWHNYASVGMGIMKDYVFVLNYCQAYAAFKRIS